MTLFDNSPNKVYDKEPQSRMIIRFQDCDPLNHLNNSKYFDYYFNAREDQVATRYDFNFGRLFQELKQSWVVYQHQIAYVRPAMVSEWVRITSRLIFFKEDTIVTEYYMTDDSGTQLKNVLWVTSKYIDVASGKRIAHPQPVMDYLEAICLTEVDFHNWNFNERIREIKQSLAGN
jgi:acyl-CoA thioester hydrolase